MSAVAILVGVAAAAEEKLDRVAPRERMVRGCGIVDAVEPPLEEGSRLAVVVEDCPALVHQVRRSRSW